VDDPDKARSVLRATLGVTSTVVGARRLVLESHLDESNAVARVLVESGLELYDLHRQETTLEDYFIRLVGGNND
jgi:hypothetical protein